MVAVGDGPGREARDVGAAARLRDCERDVLLARDHGRRHAFAHGLAREVHDGRQADVVDHQRRGHAADADPCELFVDDVVEPDVDAVADAAVALGIAETQQPDFRRPGPQPARDLAGLVPVGRVRHHLVVDEAAQLRAPRVVIFGQVAIGKPRAVEIE